MKLSELNFGKVEKDGEFNWLGLTAEEYEGKKVLTFLNDEKYIKEFKKNNTITCILTTLEISEKIKGYNYGILIVENPRKDFFELHNKLVKESFYFTKNKNKISEKAMISKKATIGDYNIIIEDNVVIESNVTIYENVTIKKNSIIRSGSRIGGNACEFSRFKDKVLEVFSAGSVLVDENVEIQNNVCIDKGVFDQTYIGKNVKIDNLVHIAHDVKIGNNTLIIACSFIGGRTRISKNSFIGPNCTIKNGLFLGENSRVTMGAVVVMNVENNEVVSGNFAIPHDQFIKRI